MAFWLATHDETAQQAPRNHGSRMTE
jgi:hypothetical protein